MYNPRAKCSRVDVVGLDPYGAVPPFIDAVVQPATDAELLRSLTALSATGPPQKWRVDIYHTSSEFDEVCR